MFGTIPAKVFFIRHAKNVTLDNVSFHYLKEDELPLFVSDDSENFVFRNITFDNIPYNNK